MKRGVRRAIASGIAAATLLSGCEATPSHHAAPNAIEQFTAKYPTLPRAVGRKVLSAVLFQTDYRPNSTSIILNTGGSGTMINVNGRREVLASADVVSLDTAQCAEGQIVFKTGEAPHQAIGYAHVNRQYVSDWTNSNELDAALLDVQQESPAPGIAKEFNALVDDVPALNLQPTVTVHSGEAAFAINYQETPYGEPRYMLSTDDPDSSPAIYGAVILGELGPGRFAMLTGLKSFGSINDSFTRERASGGPVLDARGQYLGEITGNISETAYNLLRGFGDRVPAGLYDIAIVQEVTEPQVQAMAAQITTAPDCTFLPHHGW